MENGVNDGTLWQKVIMKTAIVLLAAGIGLLAGCATEPPAPAGLPPLTSAGAKFAILPGAVQRTVTAMAGEAEIKDINKVPSLEREVYEVQFINSVANPNLLIAANGALLNTNIPSLIPTGQTVVLPLAVKAALKQHAPTGTIATVHTSQRTVYEFTFTNPDLYSKMYITDDGTILKAE